MPDVYLTVAEVAGRLKCHPHTVRRWIWDRKLRAVKLGDLVRVSERELSRFARPLEKSQPNVKAIRRFSKNAKALVSVMRRLRRKIKPADVEKMERVIAESNPPTDWRNPLA